MRRVLSLVLALLMVITCLTGLSLISVSADGTAGTITVFKQDYENGTLPEGNNGAINSIKDDGTGNHYGAVTLDANGLAGRPTASENDKRPGVALGYRLRAGKNVPYISGKHYTLSWDLGSVNGGKVTPVSAGTSGIEAMGTNKLFGFRGGQNQAFNQYFFSLNALTEEGGAAAKQTSENLSSGWRRNVATGINYKLTTSDKDLTIVPDGTVGSVNNFFFEVGIVDTLLKILVDNQAYWGAGFVKDD
ncbi:MAG: hypothetical protein SPL89_07860, partial [Clostridia bacterium]|nr:hypothetical protein [Clostridia bacterium]